jgi:Domain of unknown function (DUF4169)
MGTVVSLGKHRKAAARKDRQREAEANAVKFGRTKAQKQAETMTAARIKAQLDGQERE